MSSRYAHRLPAAPDLTSYDLSAPQVSGGKDSAVMMAAFMEAAQAAGVDDRVISYHSSLAVLEWPPVVSNGIRYPGMSELAALQSAAFGVPADRHREVTRTMPGPDGTRMPRSLLTETATYGRFPPDGQPVLPLERQGERGLQRLDADRRPPQARTRPPGTDPEGHGAAQRRGARPQEALRVIFRGKNSRQ
ncbi:hypothetical protein [Streptomyces sp. R35]|uniref:Uncharacterized protein n=1 Tax=Streptomyces sp. R35 TaxID=3238630 RepID=A0AB39RXD0_9ACTN